MALVLVYFFRGTVFPWFLNISFNGLVALNLLVLLAAVGITLSSGGRWRLLWWTAIVTFGLSVTQAIQPANSGARWLGLGLLAIGVGPLVVNSAAMAFRQAAWVWTTRGLTLLAAVFTGWYALGLPNFGAGFFSAFMNQCMLAGPMAGLGGTFALVQCLHQRSWKYGLLACVCLVPVLASGSRIATFSTVVAYATVTFRHKPLLGLIVSAFAVAGIGTLALTSTGGESANPVVAALSAKGTTNTRADLWESRIGEFMDSPILGIGVAMGTGSGSAVEASGSIRVEPGSSYLAILAMTGILGTGSFAIALGLLLRDFFRRQAPGMDKERIVGMGMFLAAHALAEGWLLSFGSPLAFLFWLWLGRVGDASAAESPARRAVQRLSRPSPRRIVGYLGRPPRRYPQTPAPR